MSESRGNIELKLANGKSISTNSGEELFWFNQSEGRSIVAPPPKVDKTVNGQQVGNVQTK